MRLAVAFVCAVFWLAAPSFALDDAPVSGDVVLSIQGEIEATNVDDRAVFNRSMLRAIGWREITTFNPFLDGEQRFGGVPLGVLLSHIGAHGGSVKGEALDGYTVTIPVQEIFDRDVLLAMEHEGREMRIRNRGPLWIIYPMTEEQAAAGDAEGRMIWQLHSLTVQP